MRAGFARLLQGQVARTLRAIIPLLDLTGNSG
jgi:hypothetical protein